MTGEIAPALDPTRKVHRVARKLVMTSGELPAQDLYGWFDLFNAACFGGRLATPLIRITPAGSPRALGDYSPRDVHGVNSTIRIAPNLYKRAARHAVATLLHEMVHAWCHECVPGYDEQGYRGHGPVFAAKCNEIGERLGFPVVASKSKARKASGVAPCEHWPELPSTDDDVITPRKPPTPAAAPTSGDGEQGDGADPDGGGLDVEAIRAEGAEAFCGLVVTWLREKADQLDEVAKGKSAATVRRLAIDLEQGAVEL